MWWQFYPTQDGRRGRISSHMMEASEQGNDRTSLQYEPIELGDEMKARISMEKAMAMNQASDKSGGG